MGSRASFCAKRAKHHSPASESAGQPTAPPPKTNGILDADNSSSARPIEGQSIDGVEHHSPTTESAGQPTASPPKPNGTLDEGNSSSTESSEGQSIGGAKHHLPTRESAGQPTAPHKPNTPPDESTLLEAAGASPAAGCLAQPTNGQPVSISRAKGNRKGTDWLWESEEGEDEKQNYDNLTYLTYVQALESFALGGILYHGYNAWKPVRKLWDAICAMPRDSLKSGLLCEGRARLPQHHEVDGANLLHLLAMFDSGPDRDSSDADSWFNFLLTKLTDSAGNERLREAAAVVRGADGSAVQIACVRGANRLARAMIEWRCDFSVAGIPFHACLERRQWEIASAILSSSHDPNVGDPLVIIWKQLSARPAAYVDSDGESHRASAFVREVLGRIGDPKRVPFQFFDAVRDLLRQLCGERVGSLLSQQSVTPQDQAALASAIVKECEPFFVQPDHSWFCSLLLHGSVLYAKHRVIGSRTICRALLQWLPPELARLVDSFIS